MAVNITDIELHKDFIIGHVQYYMGLNNYKKYACVKRGSNDNITCYFSATDFAYSSTSSDGVSYTFSMSRGVNYLYDESTNKYSISTTTQSLYLKKENSIFYTNSDAFKDYITYDKKDFLSLDCSNNENNNQTECNVILNDNKYMIMLVYIVVFVLLTNFFYKVVFR